MSHSGTRITAPVQILGDLQPVLGTSYTGLGQIITNADINKLAKCKPFCNANTSFVAYNGHDAAYWRDQARKGANVSGHPFPTPRADAGFYGLVFGSLNTTSPETGFVAPNWTYKRPTGGIGSATSEPFRALDFDGYSHTPPTPIAFTLPQNISLSSTGTGSSLVHLEFTMKNDLGVTMDEMLSEGTQKNHHAVVSLFSISNPTRVFMVRSSETIYQIFTRTSGLPKGQANIPLDWGTMHSQIGALYMTDGKEWRLTVFLAVCSGSLASNGYSTSSGDISSTMSLEYTDSNQTSVSMKNLVCRVTSWNNGLSASVNAAGSLLSTTHTWNNRVFREWRFTDGSAGWNTSLVSTSAFEQKTVYVRVRFQTGACFFYYNTPVTTYTLATQTISNMPASASRTINFDYHYYNYYIMVPTDIPAAQTYFPVTVTVQGTNLASPGESDWIDLGSQTIQIPNPNR